MPLTLRELRNRDKTGDRSAVPRSRCERCRLSSETERNKVDAALSTAYLFVIFIFVTLLPTAAMAYVGPGAGITLLGALWAVIVAVVLMVGGLLVWPFRALLRRRKNGRRREAP